MVHIESDYLCLHHSMALQLYKNMVRYIKTIWVNSRIVIIELYKKNKDKNALSI